MELQAGDPREIGGYRVERRLGEGGQGVVFLATGADGERVAIKQLRAGIVHDQRAREQLAKEVAAAEQVAPFCTARVIDARLDGDHPYVVSEFIDGPSLQQYVRRNGPMTGPALDRLAIGTATALAAIHAAGVVHRDFKPGNVMLGPDGPRVIDFGIARDLANETTVTSRVFGTPAYMAPEQLQGGRARPATDVFAWASAIAYAATGTAPFEAEHMMAVVYRITTGEPTLDGIPEPLVSVLRRCLAKEPEQRLTAQQALTSLLGRPVPERDSADPTQVLAQATRIAVAAAPLPEAGATVPYRQAAATQVHPQQPPTRQPPYPQPAPGSPYGSPQPRPAQDRKGSRGRVVAAVVVAALAAVGGGLLAAEYWGGDGSGTAGLSGAQTPDAADSTSQPGSESSGGGAEDEPTASETESQAESEPTSSDDGGGDGGDDGGGDGDARVIPEDFAGTWSGTLERPATDSTYYSVTMTLVAGRETGAIGWSGTGCSGSVTVETASKDELVLVQRMKGTDDDCPALGTVTLTEEGYDLQYEWENEEDGDDQVTGVLDG